MWNIQQFDFNLLSRFGVLRGKKLNKTVYKITVNNWEKYNGTKKRGHKCILVSTGFLADAKIRQLTPATSLLYLSLLLLMGESTQSHVEVTHESLCFHSRVKSGSLQSQLDLLQSLQLVSYASNESLLDMKGIEGKRKEGKGGEAKPKIKIPEPIPDEQSSPSPLPQLAQVWNDLCGDLPKVKGTNKARSRRIAERMREEPDIEAWAALVKRLAVSKFCLGENPRGWRADFDWLLQPEVRLKALEGKYDDRGAADPFALLRMG